MLPFQHVPRLMVIWLVSNAIFWLNAFPPSQGRSIIDIVPEVYSNQQTPGCRQTHSSWVQCIHANSWKAH
jgi:hypothetical protein